MNEKKDNYIILVIICLILISIVGLLYLNNDDKVEVVKKDNYILLNDYSRFFTVNSCIYKYITYLSGNNSDALMSVLDDEYVNSNNITKDNVYNFLNKLDGNYTFKSKKIYYQEVDKNYITYYVMGDLVKEVLDESPIKQEEYYKVNMDLKDQLFSIAPYDGKIFKEGL